MEKEKKKHRQKHRKYTDGERERADRKRNKKKKREVEDRVTQLYFLKVNNEAPLIGVQNDRGIVMGDGKGRVK